MKLGRQRNTQRSQETCGLVGIVYCCRPSLLMIIVSVSLDVTWWVQLWSLTSKSSLLEKVWNIPQVCPNVSWWSHHQLTLFPWVKLKLITCSRYPEYTNLSKCGGDLLITDWAVLRRVDQASLWNVMITGKWSSSILTSILLESRYIPFDFIAQCS